MLDRTAERLELITLVAENHGTTVDMLRPICYAITRAVQRGHNISRYLSMLLDLDVISAAHLRQFAEIYRVQHDSATTIEQFYTILRWGIDN